MSADHPEPPPESNDPVTPPAPLGWRIGARVVDAVVAMWVLVFVLVEVFGRLLGGDVLGRESAADQLSDLSTTQMWLGLALVVGVLEVLPVALRGASLGKAMLGLRVVRIDGFGRPGLLDAILRAAVLYTPLAIPYLGLLIVAVVIIPALIWPTRRGVHDVVAGTVVIRAPRDRASSGGAS